MYPALAPTRLGYTLIHLVSRSTFSRQAAAEALQQPADSGRPILKRKALATQHDTSRATRRADAARAHRLRQEVAAEGQVAGWLTRLALQPSSTAASAQDRVKAIRERLAGR